MAEVRMICVRAGQEPHLVKTPNGKMAWNDLRCWIPVEPAPPKDWRPACFNYSELVAGCSQIPFTNKPACQECPYRNLE